MYQSIAIEIGRALNFYGFNNPDVVIEVAYCCGGGLLLDPLVEAVCPCRLRVSSIVVLPPMSAPLGEALRCPVAIGATMKAGGSHGFEAGGVAGAEARQGAGVPRQDVHQLVQTPSSNAAALLAQLGLFAIALVLIGVFAKFAVVDPWRRARQAATRFPQRRRAWTCWRPRTPTTQS